MLPSPPPQSVSQQPTDTFSTESQTQKRGPQEAQKDRAGRRELPHFIAAWIIFVICQKVGQIPKYKNTRAAEPAPEDEETKNGNGIRKQSCDWATNRRIPGPVDDPHLRPKLTHLRGSGGPPRTFGELLPLFCSSAGHQRNQRAGSRGGNRNKSEISSSHLLRFIKLFPPNGSTVLFVGVWSRNPQSSCVIFLRFTLLKFFDRPLSEGGFPSIHLSLYSIFLEKIFTHLANYLLIRPLKLPAKKQKKKKATKTEKSKRNGKGKCVNTISLWWTHLSQGNRPPK